MNYTYTETYDEIDNLTIVRIEKVDEEGNGWIFNNDPANRHYQEYLRYTAWVEAGNTPEDFWTQSEVDY